MNNIQLIRRPPLTDDGYCVHGVYVGGMGRDYLCGMCEAGAVHPATVDALEVRANGRYVGTYQTLPVHLEFLVKDCPEIFAVMPAKMTIWLTHEERDEFE